MCGRYVSSSQPDEIAKYFGAELSESLAKADDPEPNFNVAPTTNVFVVLETGETRRVDVARWGLVPSWAKDLSIGARMINARAETLATKPAFKRAFERKRCIIPADGFYEWKKLAGQKQKQPMYIHRADGDRFAFAGLWELWRNPEAPDDPPLRTCTIITGQPNEKVAEIHDRMPVMLPPDAWSTWLDHDNHDLDTLGRLLVPAPASLIAMHPVSTAVNNVRNKEPSLIDPAEPVAGPGDGAQATLL
jgi:putative SOS response-associated peptidase YedK